MRPAERAKQRAMLAVKVFGLCVGIMFGALSLQAITGLSALTTSLMLKPVTYQLSEEHVRVDRDSGSYIYKTLYSPVMLIEVYRVGGKINARVFNIFNYSRSLQVRPAVYDEMKLWYELYVEGGNE